jgi:ubiquinone/menaquinone biosynthesis C-methylase UbiE
LNVGASPIWSKTGWFALDHKAIRSNAEVIAGTAQDINLHNEMCSAIFCSHVFEHIPHIQLPLVLNEFHRVLKQEGILRILTPDLRKIATAYVTKDINFFQRACSEDENIRTDLGIGGSFMNFIVSPGQDTALFSRNLDTFISGYAHLYSYDYEMLKILLENTGFKDIECKTFCESSLIDFHEPLHVSSLPPVWKDMNTTFYKNTI